MLFRSLVQPLETRKQELHQRLDELARTHATALEELRQLRESSQKELSDERKWRESLQTQNVTLEKKLQVMQDEIASERAEQRAANERRKRELIETESSSSNKKSNTRLLEEKHALEEELKQVKLQLKEQERLRGELEDVFAQRLENLISTIDAEYDSRQRLEHERDSMVQRVEEIESKLLEAIQDRQQLEAQLVEEERSRLALESHLIQEMAAQNTLKVRLRDALLEREVVVRH